MMILPYGDIPYAMRIALTEDSSRTRKIAHFLCSWLYSGFPHSVRYVNIQTKLRMNAATPTSLIEIRGTGR